MIGLLSLSYSASTRLVQEVHVCTVEVGIKMERFSLTYDLF